MTTRPEPTSVSELPTAPPHVTTPLRDFLPFATPLIGEEEIQEVVDTLRSTWITTGPKAKRFEQEFAAYLGAPGALALSSCTAGLHTALVTLGIGPGAEVVTTPMTFAASVNVIEHVGARPVLVDVEPDTLNLDPGLVAAALTPRTRAILPVHYAGHPAALDPIGDIARPGGLAVIEDAAHALPAKYKGRPIGSGANPVAFSFYPTKNMTTAEGGMLTGDAALLERARTVSLHGMTRDAWSRYDRGGQWFYEVVLPGFKYNMTDIQAALGMWQLRKLAAFQERRRAVVRLYTEAFAGQDALEVPVERSDVEHAWHLYVLRLREEALRIDRNVFIDELKQRNIGTSVHFIPIHLHPYYRDKYGYRPESFPVALTNYRRMLSLPLSARVSDADAADVISAVLDIVRRYRR
ncbi:MAG: UDP-4-amino-4,6-dideoxy-N-acetyl-beta-L-altrosamine transaminase [Gemmatimonadetes bacterium]|nr:MAG: UDP-4-amino-4,6-dideoxy-N-acetyl-beta-L-altrosamine transaminase [Gemmatimonadota bacterium]